MKGFSRVAVCLFVCCLTVTLSAARTYKETDGLVIMEIENTESPLGKWVLKDDNPNFNGDGFLEFTGNEITKGPPKSPLEFRFRISKAGIYSIKLRARKRLDGAESDLCNDCYVRVEGDYASGSNEVALRALQNDTKLYGGPANGWGWAGNLDARDADHTQAKYDFKAGEEYLLVVSGRSKRYQIDRIVFVHSSANLSDAESGPESPLVEDTNPVDNPGGSISGELKKWHKVTLTLTGPEASESGNPNPFTDYRMDVTFTNGSSSLTVPGYFAADGDAANSGASSGNTWRAHLCPDKTGTWNYSVSFMEGANCAVNGGGTALPPFDGIAGSFVVAETDKSGRDMRAKGWLQYTGEHYLRFKGSGEYFLKQGADAPENFLAYEDFDGPFKSDGRKDNLVKSWSAHVTDWNDGDPAWNGNKGKGIIGAINYLASEGMNVFSFLPMNIGGDDRNVFPYLDYDERYRMDCSRLDQWAIVFEHGTKMGMFLHFKTQETENELLLDGGDPGARRKLYYRELIARFAHNPALNWNLGEENNDQSDKQRKAMAQYFHDNDPYGHHIVIHTYPGGDDNIYTPLLGSNSKLTGPSLQLSSSTFSDVHARVCEWIDKSANAGKPWAVAVDEPGDASHALRPDNDAGSSHEDGRKNGIWGTFLAGGWGNEWYFGYQHDHSDLTCEDFRSRDQWWDYCRYALEFFHHNAIPFHEMVNDNGLSSADNDYCFYKEGEVYVIYLKNGGTTNLDLGAAEGSFQVRWYDPRNGGSLQNGSVSEVAGGGEAALGNACIARLSGESTTFSRVVPMIR